MGQSAKKIPIIIVIVCITLTLISVYLEKNKKEKILHSLESSIQSTGSTE
tara:strand:+ start:178 stop:327 length:150 start_codon:yes stop_codon:yes gene_type:complete